MTVLVTAAPGCHFMVTPHPSGLPGLRPLVVYGGQQVRVTEARAADLWKARLIRDPATGALPVPYVAEAMPITIDSRDPRQPVSVWDGIGAPPPPVAEEELQLRETDASDPTRVARRPVAVGSNLPRVLIDVTFENAMRDPVLINQQAADLPWPI